MAPLFKAQFRDVPSAVDNPENLPSRSNRSIVDDVAASRKASNPWAEFRAWPTDTWLVSQRVELFVNERIETVSADEIVLSDVISDFDEVGFGVLGYA